MKQVFLLSGASIILFSCIAQTTKDNGHEQLRELLIHHAEEQYRSGKSRMTVSGLSIQQVDTLSEKQLLELSSEYPVAMIKETTERLAWEKDSLQYYKKHITSQNPSNKKAYVYRIQELTDASTWDSEHLANMHQQADSFSRLISTASADNKAGYLVNTKGNWLLNGQPVDFDAEYLVTNDMKIRVYYKNYSK